jgi:hypothetical protein
MASAACCWAGFRTGMSAGAGSWAASFLPSFLSARSSATVVEHAQVLRQAGQRHFAQRALVVVGGKGASASHAGRQRRELAAHGQRILELVAGTSVSCLTATISPTTSRRPKLTSASCPTCGSHRARTASGSRSTLSSGVSSAI